jgi:hypothetical protein
MKGAVMKPRVIGALVLLSLACALGTTTLRASDMVGVYALVEKTILEPAAADPSRVQIWGVFAVAKEGASDAYTEPQRGYLYYECPQGKAATCRSEWADITSVAGKGQGVAFAMRRKPIGRVRKADEKPASPDPYPIAMGVSRLDSDAYHSAMTDKLKAALRQQ